MEVLECFMCTHTYTCHGFVGVYRYMWMCIFYGLESPMTYIIIHNRTHIFSHVPFWFRRKSFFLSFCMRWSVCVYIVQCARHISSLHKWKSWAHNDSCWCFSFFVLFLYLPPFLIQFHWISIAIVCIQIHSKIEHKFQVFHIMLANWMTHMLLLFVSIIVPIFFFHFSL